jgi:hypothetical protein
VSLDSEISALHARIAVLEARERVQHATIVASLARERVSVCARQAAEAVAAAAVAEAGVRAAQAEAAAEAAEARAVAAERDAEAARFALAAARRTDAPTHTAPGLPVGPATSTPARLAPVRGVAVAPADPAVVAHWLATSGPRVRQLGAGLTRDRLSGDDALELRAAVGQLLAAAQGTATRAAAHDRAIALLHQIRGKA